MLWFGWLAFAGGLVFFVLTYFPAGALARRAVRWFDPTVAMTGKAADGPEILFWSGYIGLQAYLLACVLAGVWKTLVYLVKGTKAYWRSVQWLQGEDKK